MANIKNLNPSDPDKGINISLPTKGSTNWSEDFENYFALKLRDHDHSGGGNGALLNATSLSVGQISNISGQNQVINNSNSQAIDNTLFFVDAGETLVVEYLLQCKNTGKTRAGTLHMIHYNAGGVQVQIADEYMGPDLYCDFYIADGNTGGEPAGRLYANALSPLSSGQEGEAGYEFRFFRRKVTIA